MRKMCTVYKEVRIHFDVAIFLKSFAVLARNLVLVSLEIKFSSSDEL
jgi:hypothetical protein